MLLKKLAYIIYGLLFLPLQLLQGWDVNAGSNNVARLGESLAKKYNMTFVNYGVGTVVDSKNVAWDISLLADRTWTIDQARPVVTAMMQDFWISISCDQAALNHMRLYGSEEPKYDPILTPKRLGLRVAFWDKNVNRPLPPHVSRIIVSEGMIHYYMANPRDQSLQAPITEPLELFTR